MNQYRARLFYRLSLLMILMSFLSFVVLIGSLFILNLQGAFVCDTPGSAGVCTLRDRYLDYRILITGSTTLIVVFIILAWYFQQFFLVKKPKEKKARVKKVKEMFSKDQNLAVFEIEPANNTEVPVAAKPPSRGLSKRKKKKRKPQLAEYTISNDVQDESLDAIKHSVFTQPDKPLKLPKDLEELADDDSDYLESDGMPDNDASALKEPSGEDEPNETLSTQETSSEDPKDTSPTPDATLNKEEQTEKEDTPVKPSKEEIDKQTVKEESVDQTKVPVLAKDTKEARAKKETPKKQKQPSLDDTVKRKRRTLSHTKEDLSLIVAKRVHLENDQARNVIDITFDIIKDTLAKHEKVNILKFGTFSTKELKARTMQVPSKEEAETTIPAHHVVRFKSSAAFDEFVNEDDVAPPIEFEQVTAVKKEAPKETTIKKDTLIEAISNQTDLSLNDVKKFMKTFIATTQETLADKDSISLTNFGTFQAVYHKEKKMVVPATKEEKIIPGYYTVKFRPSKAFTTFLNEN